MNMYTLQLKSVLLPLMFVLLLNACTTAPPLNTTGVDPSLTPQGVTANPRTALGKTVQWGGTILGTSNLQDRTQIEVLAYPLDSSGKPQSDSTPLGRFILEKSGYLEPATYKQGRLISVVGTVTGTRAGKIGEASYEHPLVEARDVYLWPETQDRGGSSVHFGFGVGSGGGWGSGVGIGF